MTYSTGNWSTGQWAAATFAVATWGVPVVEYTPSFDFSDDRNSQYVPLL